MVGETLIQIRKERLEKAKKLRDMGIDPYPAISNKNISNKEILDNYAKYEDSEYIVAGRIMSYREHGGLVFADIADESGTIQFYIRKDILEATSKEKQIIGYDDLNLLDLGDFVEGLGTVTKTKRGEISILIKELKILTKSIRPLPDKWDGLKNKEERFRRRYLELAIRPEVRERFVRKSKFWKKARDFMDARGFIEVETPILELVTGGADASPFVTHHNALNQDFFLRISSELYQKRLIGGGFEKIYTLGPNFRNEGIDDEHLQEYYQLEYYWAYSDVNDTIEFTKEMYKYLAQEVWGTTKFEKGEYKFDLADEWEVIDYIKIIQERFNIDVFTASLEDIYNKIRENGVEIEFEANRNRLVDNLWKIIRKGISGPAALINAPKFISPLAKSYFGTEHITQRFQPIIAGSEVGNAYSELNDPIDQLERFIEQQTLRDSGDDEAQMLDIDFVEMLEYGMPPTSCIGFSERLFWFLEGVSAREGTFFPQMKHETDDVTLNVYSDIKKYLVNETMVDFNIFNLEQRDVASIQPEVLKDNQGIKFGYVIFDNVKVLKESDYLNKLKDEILKKIPSKDEIKEDKNLEGYREIYKRNGVDPRSRLNSAEALLKRISSGKGLYSINNVVDTYNLTSIENKVAMAAYDFDQVVGEIKLRYAAAGEEMLKIGDEEVSKTFDKELIYADEKGPICFDFNYRDSDRTKITDKTQRIIVFVDGNKSVSEDEIVKVLNIVSSRMQKATGATAVGYGLSWQDASSKFFVGKVLEINKHPNADRLMISKVDIGHKTVQIITSATNVKVNDIVPVAITGAIIPNKLDSDGNNLVLESGSIRGELSEAMMCSMHELGKGEDAENIWILDNQQFSSKIGEIFEI